MVDSGLEQSVRQLRFPELTIEAERKFVNRFLKISMRYPMEGYRQKTLETSMILLSHQLHENFCRRDFLRPMLYDKAYALVFAVTVQVGERPNTVRRAVSACLRRC